ncbi:MAG: DinB family protein, partial [Candidatus Acidiferrales bacterium]
SEAVLANWNDIGNRLIAMAEDWPEEKYSYRPNADVRTFQQVLLHVAGSNYDLINHMSGQKLGDGANDPSVETYKSKAQTVAFLKKSVSDGATEIQKEGDAGILKRLSPWIGYTEHMGEHYGQLVAYYRNNGVVPPESRPKK